MTGVNLAQACKTGYMKTLFESGLYYGPKSATNALYVRFGAHASESGENIDGIKAYRSITKDLDHAQRDIAASLMILAPHTHWRSALPVIYTKHGDFYFVGPRQPKKNSHYLPVSFLVTDENAMLPYEWLDLSSQEIDFSAAAACLELIEFLWRSFRDQGWPLSIGINFRFRSLLSEEIYPSIENPHKGAILGYRNASKIDALALHSVATETKTSEQVSWLLCLPSDQKLNEDEKHILDLLRSNGITAKTLASILPKKVTENFLETNPLTLNM